MRGASKEVPVTVGSISRRSSRKKSLVRLVTASVARPARSSRAAFDTETPDEIAVGRDRPRPRGRPRDGALRNVARGHQRDDLRFGKLRIRGERGRETRRRAREAERDLVAAHGAPRLKFEERLDAERIREQDLGRLDLVTLALQREAAALVGRDLAEQERMAP